MNIKMEKVDHYHTGIMKSKISIQKCVEEQYKRGEIGSVFYSIHNGWQNLNIMFQKGNPAEKINGITDESLLSVVLDRLEDTQKSKYATEYNKIAIEHIKAALSAINDRTTERVTRGVEGSQNV